MLYELLCNGQHPYEGGRPMAGEAVRDAQTIHSYYPPDLPPS